MSDNTTRLQLPWLAEAQARKHVTINESLRRLDAVIQTSAVSRSLDVQPASPDDGTLYILPPGKTGDAWGGMSNHALAYYRDGSWEQLNAREGWQVWVEDEDVLLVHDGSSWTEPLSQRVNRAGDTMTGPLTLASGPFSVAGNLLSAGSGRVAVGADTVDTIASFTVERSQLETLLIGPHYNDGVAYNTGDVRLTVGAWSGTPQIFLARNGVSGIVMKVNGSGNFVLEANGTECLVARGGTALTPGIAAGQHLGSASYPWDEVHTQGGVITTSDVRTKRDITACPLGLDFVRSLRPVAYLREGDEDNAPIQTGFIAQEVARSLPGGLSWAGWMTPDPDDADGRQGLRYDAFIAPLVAAVQELAERVEKLESAGQPRA